MARRRVRCGCGRPIVQWRMRKTIRRGAVKAFRDHDLCTRCFQGYKDSIRAALVESAASLMERPEASVIVEP